MCTYICLLNQQKALVVHCMYIHVICVYVCVCRFELEMIFSCAVYQMSDTSLPSYPICRMWKVMHRRYVCL